MTLYEPGAGPEDIRALRATADLFAVLRVQPAIGRGFTAENEVEGRHHVVVLSDGLWRRRFAADPGVVGRTIPLDGTPYEIVGVMPPEMTYPVGAGRATDVYVPYVVPESERTRIPNRHGFYLQAVGRLKPGLSLAAGRSAHGPGRARAAGHASRLEQGHPRRHALAASTTSSARARSRGC